MNYCEIFKSVLLKDAPLHLTFFVTAKCNFRCKMCFYKDNLNTGANQELSLDEISRLSSSMPNFMWLLISGGEPFLRDDLPEIIKIFNKNNKINFITIPTNGFYSKKIADSVEKILQGVNNCFLNVNVSINGIGQDHDDITGVQGSFDNVIETVRLLKNLKKKYSNFNIGSIITHTEHNQKELRKLITFIIDELKVDNVALGFEFSNPFKKDEHPRGDVNYYIDAANFLTSYYIKGKINYFDMPLKRLNFAKDLLIRDILLEIHNNKKFIMPCYAGKLNLVLDELGNVYPCEFIKEKFGNIRDANYNFRTIWDSNEAKKGRKFIKKTKCFCEHECYLATNLIFNPMLYPKILRKLITLNKGDYKIAGN